MTREELKGMIKKAIDEKAEQLTISGSFGCGYETFEITINHEKKEFYCDEYFPICVLCDIREFGYRDCGGLNPTY